jgi:hypothetical protein
MTAMQSTLAWIWAPAVLYAVGLGLGLLVEAATRFRTDTALTVPLGFAAGILVVVPLYYLGAHDTVVAIVLAVLAVAGLVLRRDGLRARLWPGPALWAAAATYVLYLAPTALSGSWTWAGYNFTNDPSNTMTAAWWILHHGFDQPAVRDSTTTFVAGTSIEQGYPLGAHLLLGSVRPLVGVPLMAMYQPFIAFAAAMASAAMVQIGRRLGLQALWAAPVAVAATGANLLYAYGTLGGVKEIVMVALLATAAGVAAQASPGRWTVGAAITAVIPLAASVPAYSAGGLIYAGLFGVAAVALAVLDRARKPVGALARLAGIGAVAFVVLCAPSLAAAVRFGTGVNNALEVSPLGQLLRPLPLAQIGGIWWADDWRAPLAPGMRWDLNRLVLALVFASAVLGIVAAIRRRQLPVLAGVAVMLAAILVIAPRTTPYGDSKLYVMVSPFVVLTAGFGAWALAQRVRVAGIVLGLIIAGGIAFSDAIGYHELRLAPIDRMNAMEDIAHAAGDRQEVLDYEWEEWAKYFFRDARVNSGTEIYFSPRGMPLRHGNVALAQHYDLDEVRLSYVTSFPAIVSRRAPDASRPPASYRLAHANRYYELWKRDPQVKVLHHLPIQGPFESQLEVPCAQIQRFARQAAPGDELVAARHAANITMQPTQSRDRSPGLPPAQDIAGTIVPGAPGHAGGSLFVPGGRYRVWLYGSSGRPIHAVIDGRTVGSMKQVNSPGQWVEVAQVTLPRGQHRLEIQRPGGSLAPGDGYAGRIGPMVLEPVARGEILRAAPSRARDLCRQPLDWVEIVRRA